jgi:hypothetical protein
MEKREEKKLKLIQDVTRLRKYPKDLQGLPSET